MWGIPALIFLIAFLHRAAPGVIAKDLMQAFGMTGATVGLLSAMYFYSYAGFMVPGGVLIDSLGPRRVIAAGGAVMGLGSLAMGLAASPAVLFTGRLLVGLGAAVTFTGALKIAGSWFPPSQFGMMSAVTATVGVLGALIGNQGLDGSAGYLEGLRRPGRRARRTLEAFLHAAVTNDHVNARRALGSGAISRGEADSMTGGEFVERLGGGRWFKMIATGDTVSASVDTPSGRGVVFCQIDRAAGNISRVQYFD